MRRRCRRGRRDVHGAIGGLRTNTSGRLKLNSLLRTGGNLLLPSEKTSPQFWVLQSLLEGERVWIAFTAPFTFLVLNFLILVVVVVVRVILILRGTNFAIDVAAG